jgi:hypothetical protein
MKHWIAAAMLATCHAAYADDVKDLEEELALTIEDASPSKAGSAQLNAGMRFDRMRKGAPGEGRNEVQLTPRLQIGVTNDFQVSIATPYRVGNASDTSQGEFRLDGLYRFNRETGAMPSFAVDVGLERPYGAGSGGTEVLVKGILSKSLGMAEGTNRVAQVHVNLQARHNMHPDATERRHRYLAGAALSKQLSEHWLIATDFIREQQRDRNAATSIGEIGTRWKASEKTVLSGAIGHGFNKEAPQWRLVVGLQRSLD